jgi:hypothetical protein
MPFPRFTRQKALLAIAFASGTFHAAQPALPQNESDSAEVISQPASIDSSVRRIADSKKATPEIRAYYLLMIAPNCLIDSVDGVVQLEKTFETFAVPRSSDHFLEIRDGNMLLNFADSLLNDEVLKSNSRSVTMERSTRADMVTLEALRQIDQSPATSNKLYAYLAASRLFAKTGNLNEMRRCNTVLNEFLRSAETPANSDEKQLQLAASILNSMAFALVPLKVWDRAPRIHAGRPPRTEVMTYTEKNFKESEKLKFRAINLIDRLQATNFLRRKAHRDLALWYEGLDKTTLADKQKQILFELVGRKDENLLYPQTVACGQLDWFPKPASDGKVVARLIGCGMG